MLTGLYNKNIFHKNLIPLHYINFDEQNVEDKITA